MMRGAIASLAVACASHASNASNADADAGLLTAPDAGNTGVSQRRIVGYYVASKRRALPPAGIAWNDLTHVAHAFASPDIKGGIANLASFVDPELIAQAHAHGVKVVASVGGASGDFSGVASSPSARAATVAALVSLCADDGYDGIDVDWEFPDASTAPAWAQFLGELRIGLDGVRPQLSLSAAVSASPAKIDALPIGALSQLDWVGALTYAYAGPSSKTVSYLAPLESSQLSISKTIDHLLARGIAPERVLIGLPFYGYEFKDGPPGTAVSSSSAVVEWDYRDLAPVIGKGWERSWDATAHVPYLRNGKSFLTYEDEEAIAATCTFAATRALGGALVWQLAAGTLDGGAQPLLAAAQACR